MAFPTDTATSSDLSVLIPEIWGEKVNNFFRDSLVMADFFLNRSDEVQSGGDTLHTPSLTEMSANSKSNGSQVTLNSPSESEQTLTINTWEEVSFNIEDKEAAQVKRSYTLMEQYASNAGYTIADSLEQSIAAEFSNFSNTVGGSTSDLADSDIREAIATLEGNSVPNVYSGDVAFFVHPNTFWNQIQGIDKFSLADNSPTQDPVAQRPDATLYGIPVRVSNNVPNVSGSDGRENVLAHRDAIHWAAAPLGSGGSEGSVTGSMGVRVQSNYQPDYLSTLTTADILYGTTQNRDEAGVLMYSDD
jgi:hypothetical protein